MSATDEQVTATLSRHADQGALTVSELVGYTHLTTAEVGAELSRLRNAGTVRQMPGKHVGPHVLCWGLVGQEAAR